MLAMGETMEVPLSLNPDCWLLICDLLSDRDIFKLSKVSTVFQKFMETHVLPTRFKNLQISFKNYDSCEDEEYFRTVLDAIWPTVTSVQLFYLPHKLFELLKLYRFPCAHKVCITVGTSYMRSRYMNDADITELSAVFPNLRAFTPHGICRSRTIELYSHLENLTITYCAQLSFTDFQSMLLALNLKSLTLDMFKRVTKLNREAQLKLSKLEELKLNSQELSWLCVYDANDPIVFKNLKLLVVTDRLSKDKNIKNLFKDMKLIVTRDVYELEIVNGNEFICEFMIPEKYEFLNEIHKLKCVHCVIPMGVFAIPSRFNGMRELYFYDCHAITHEIIREILFNSEKLDLLSFEECDTPVIDEPCLNALSIRKKRFTFNWYKNWPDICYKKYEGIIKFECRSYISSTYDPLTIKFR